MGLRWTGEFSDPGGVDEPKPMLVAKFLDVHPSRIHSTVRRNVLRFTEVDSQKKARRLKPSFVRPLIASVKQK